VAGAALVAVAEETALAVVVAEVQEENQESGAETGAAALLSAMVLFVATLECQESSLTLLVSARSGIVGLATFGVCDADGAERKGLKFMAKGGRTSASFIMGCGLSCLEHRLGFVPMIPNAN
jgi:hypothetical protein